jgi:hypothetical protein
MLPGCGPELVGNALFTDTTTASSQHTAQNAFGATTTVTARSSVIFGLAASHAVAAQTFVNALRPMARQLKNDLSLLFVFRVTDPANAIVSCLGGLHTATLDSPFESVSQYHYLRGDLLSIWVYNFATGQIYAKFN